ncbi:hypothetical protein WS87_28310 [Burkholderia sp. MSMB0856]|nr:hypothetical protein WS87_28310 [Burkholderia sp. MSMB0856]KVH38314.1 hypothetical protein WS87_08680 [Burkholderia sp. MSMB0856]
MDTVVLFEQGARPSATGNTGRFAFGFVVANSVANASTAQRESRYAGLRACRDAATTVAYATR